MSNHNTQKTNNLAEERSEYFFAVEQPLKRHLIETLSNTTPNQILKYPQIDSLDTAQFHFNQILQKLDTTKEKQK